MFLDLEAIASDGSEGDSEDQEMDEEFMNGTYYHAYLFPVILTEISCSEDAFLDNNDGSHAQLFQSMNVEENNSNDLEGLTEHGNSRNSPGEGRKSDSNEAFQYQLKDTDVLWEIGCKVSLTYTTLQFLTYTAGRLGLRRQ